MKKASMVCWNCISFERGRKVCKEKPGEAIQIEHPETNWCGSGSWENPYDSSKLLYWGQWSVLERTKMEYFKDSWNNLKKAIDQGDEDWISTYSNEVVYRSRDITDEDMVDFMGEEEARNFIAWKSLLFSRSASIRWKEVKKEAEELDYP